MQAPNLNDMYGRQISSLSYLLGQFEVEFVRANGQYDKVAKLPGSDEERPVINRVDTYRRKDRPAPWDVEVLYNVVGWNPLAEDKGKLNELLRDLQHAASCGCSGCANRIYWSWKQFQARKAAALESTPPDS